MTPEQRDAERLAFEAAVTGAMEPGMTISTARDAQGRYRAIGMNTFRKVWDAGRRFAPAEELAERTRALEIADESMEELIRCHGVPLAMDGSYGLVDAKGSEVTALNQADPPLVEAFIWLHGRGLADVREDKDGEIIVLKEPST